MGHSTQSEENILAQNPISHSNFAPKHLYLGIEFLIVENNTVCSRKKPANDKLYNTQKTLSKTLYFI